jgi:hypothetical protein
LSCWLVSPQVDPCKGNKTADPKHPGRTGTSWQIPLSLGKPKQGKDRKGAPCDVYDFVVHPITKEMAVRDARFRGLVVETAMENIEKNFSPKLDRSWTVRIPSWTTVNTHTHTHTHSHSHIHTNTHTHTHTHSYTLIHTLKLSCTYAKS